MFADFSANEPSSQNLFRRLLDAGVAIVPGVFFGSKGEEGRARMMFACPPDHIGQCMDRIEKTLR